jgi:hypothetical protein
LQERKSVLLEEAAQDDGEAVGHEQPMEERNGMLFLADEHAKEEVFMLK